MMMFTHGIIGKFNAYVTKSLYSGMDDLSSNNFGFHRECCGARTRLLTFLLRTSQSWRAAKRPVAKPGESQLPSPRVLVSTTDDS